MRKCLILILSFMLLAGAPGLMADPVTVQDDFWGGKPKDQKDRDVVGAASVFDISKMKIKWIGRTVDIQIFSGFFQELAKGSGATLGATLGDLFISSDGWSPFGGDPHHVGDTSTNYAGSGGEDWEFALVFDTWNFSRNGNKVSDGSVALYDVGDGLIRTSDYYFGSTGMVFRTGQEVRFAPSVNSSLLAWGTWDLNPAFLHIEISYDGFPASQEYGYHWGMTCANDIMEFGAPGVPEPATFFLVGSGLLLAAALSRRRFSSKQ